MIHFNGTFLFVNCCKVSLCELTRLCNCYHGNPAVKFDFIGTETIMYLFKLSCKCFSPMKSYLSDFFEIEHKLSFTFPQAIQSITIDAIGNFA